MLNLTLNDVVHIGNSAFDSGNGVTSFICDSETSNLECLQLRAVLEGSGYAVIAIEEFAWNGGAVDVMFITNLPYDLYSNIMAKHCGSSLIRKLALLDQVSA